MKYKYYLDGVLLQDEPMGWQELETNIQRQTEIKGIFQTQDVKLTFYGDGYDILKAKFDTNFCLQSTIQIYEQRDIDYVLIFDGLVFISACSYFANVGTIEATLEDNSFFAKIYNNKNIDVNCQVGKSKNLVDYTGATTDLFKTFDVCLGTYNAELRACVTVFEAFRSLIAFMTDDTVDFESTLFDVGGLWNSTDQRLVITSGLKIGSVDPAVYGAGEVLIPRFSFMKMFQEIDKNINIGLMIDNTGTRPKVIIESNDFFYNNTSLMKLDYINGLKVYIAQDKLYGTIHFGSSTTLDGSSCPDPTFPEQQEFLSFKDEQYYVLGTCNLDTELNLVRDWVVSSNVIQSVTPPLNETTYDGNIFLVVCNESGGVNLATQGNPFNFLSATPRFYNEALLNKNVALRYLGGVPNSITKQLQDITDECNVGRVGLNYPVSAGLSALNIKTNGPTLIYNPIDYNDKTTPPFFDTNNRFTLATDSYTCGPASGGLYAFKITQVVNISNVYGDSQFQIDANNHHKLNLHFKVNQFDSLSNFLGTYDFETKSVYTYLPFNTAPLIGNHTLESTSPLFVMAAGDYLKFSVEMNATTVGVAAMLYFVVNLLDGAIETIFTSKGGGILQEYDPAMYPVYKYDFTYPITPDQFDTIKNNPHKAITINIDGVNNMKCYVDNIKYNHKTQLADMTLLRATNT